MNKMFADFKTKDKVTAATAVIIWTSLIMMITNHLS